MELFSCIVISTLGSKNNLISHECFTTCNIVIITHEMKEIGENSIILDSTTVLHQSSGCRVLVDPSYGDTDMHSVEFPVFLNSV